MCSQCRFVGSRNTFLLLWCGVWMTCNVWRWTAGCAQVYLFDDGWRREKLTPRWYCLYRDVHIERLWITALAMFLFTVSWGPASVAVLGELNRWLPWRTSCDSFFQLLTPHLCIGCVFYNDDILWKTMDIGIWTSDLSRRCGGCKAENACNGRATASDSLYCQIATSERDQWQFVGRIYDLNAGKDLKSVEPPKDTNWPRCWNVKWEESLPTVARVLLEACTWAKLGGLAKAKQQISAQLSEPSPACSFSLVQPG